MINYYTEFFQNECNVGSSISSASWDPSGRFLGVFIEKSNNVSIFNLFGDLNVTVDCDKATQFLWRPRMIVSIEKTEEEKIRKNIKAINEKYDTQDEEILNHKEFLQKKIRREQRDTFNSFLKEGRNRWSDLKDKRIKLLGWDEDHFDEVDYLEVIDKEHFIEEVVNA